jgi:CheY-like chemotaxis protein
MTSELSRREYSRSGSGGRRATDHVRLDRGRPSTAKPSVLVVDDDPGICLITVIYLRASGWKVFTADNGHVAIENAQALLPDAIVMDLEMPGFDGYEAIRRLNGSVATQKIPVVAVTENPNSRSKAFEAGCAAHLIKPCAPWIVWAQICALLRLPETRPTTG